MPPAEQVEPSQPIAPTEENLMSTDSSESMESQDQPVDVPSLTMAENSIAIPVNETSTTNAITEDGGKTNDGLLDFDTARTRADAEDKDRTYAASDRKHARFLSGRADRYAKILDEEGENALHQVLRSVPGPSWEHATYDEIRREPGRLQYEAGRKLESAEAQDRYADRVGDWAEVLHNHPVSEAYLKEVLRWGREEIRPKDLVALEDRVADDVKEENAWNHEVESMEKRVKSAQERGDLSSLTAEIIRRIQNHTDRSPELWEAYLQLEANEASTVKDIKELYERFCQETAASFGHRANMVAGMLEGIRSGRATEYQSQSQRVLRSV